MSEQVPTVTRVEDLMWLVYHNGTRLVMRDDGSWFTRAGNPWTSVPAMIAVQGIAEGYFRWIHTAQRSIEFLLSDKGRRHAKLLSYSEAHHAD